MPKLPFTDRASAGCLLAKQLVRHVNRDNVIALALPRGGVPVAYEVATSLHVALELILVRKIGLPSHDHPAHRVG